MLLYVKLKLHFWPINSNAHTSINRISKISNIFQISEGNKANLSQIRRVIVENRNVLTFICAENN